MGFHEGGIRFAADFADDILEDPTVCLRVCAVLNEPNFTRPMAVTNSGWSSADLRPLMELVWPSETGIWKTCSASLAILRNPRTAAAEKNARAQIIEQPGLLQILRHQLENFLQPQRHDALQMFDVDGLERQAEFIGDGDVPAPGFLVQQRRAVLELEFFRAAQRHFQAVSQVIGNMVAADGQHAGVPDDTAGIHDVIRRAAADINHQSAQLLLIARQQRERRGQAIEHNFVHFQLQPLDEPDGILQTIGVAVDDMNVHFQARPQHPDRIRHAVLAVHEKVLADGMNDVVLRRAN